MLYTVHFPLCTEARRTKAVDTKKPAAPPWMLASAPNANNNAAAEALAYQQGSDPVTKFSAASSNERACRPYAAAQVCPAVHPANRHLAKRRRKQFEAGRPLPPFRLNRTT